jgi:hypothetical protein
VRETVAAHAASVIAAIRVGSSNGARDEYKRCDMA